MGVCSEVGTYAGGFFVRPRTIDFAKSLKMFLTPWENPVGIIVVGVIFILFFVLLYWALRKDKKDVLLVSVHCSTTMCYGSNSRLLTLLLAHLDPFFFFSYHR